MRSTGTMHTAKWILRIVTETLGFCFVSGPNKDLGFESPCAVCFPPSPRLGARKRDVAFFPQPVKPLCILLVVAGAKRVCVRSRNKPQIGIRPVGPGAERQPSPEGLGGGSKLWSAGGAALPSFAGAAPLVLKRYWGTMSQPFRAGLTFGSRPYGPDSDLWLLRVLTQTLRALIILDSWWHD
jgi:hypothetical protein